MCIRDRANSLKQGLSEINGGQILSPMTRENSSGLVSFNIDGWVPEEAVAKFWENHQIVCRQVAFPKCIRASMHFFNTEEEVVKKMNDNQYGLSSGVYTKDLGRGLRVSKAIRAGITFVNTYRLISPSAPFGGMKDSGYGKEAGIESIKDYTRIKTTWFNTSEKPMSDPFTMG